MERNRELDDAQSGREVAADLADHVDHAVADVLRDLRQFGFREAPQVCGRQDPIE
jgi:hypothetical protein